MTHNETAAALAVELTIITGEIWRTIPDPETHNQRPQIYSPSAYLTIGQHWQTKRLSISASLPRGMKSASTASNITCDPSRTPEAIARDIANRLLSDAREYYTKSKAYDTNQRKEEAKHALIDRMIKQRLPYLWRHGGDDKYTNCYHKGPDMPEIEAHRTYKDEIKITVTLKLKPALDLLKQLTGEITQ